MVSERVSSWLCMIRFRQSCLYLHVCQYGRIIGRFTELMPMKVAQKLNYNRLSMILWWQRKMPFTLQTGTVRKHRSLKNLLTEKGTN